MSSGLHLAPVKYQELLLLLLQRYIDACVCLRGSKVAQVKSESGNFKGVSRRFAFVFEPPRERASAFGGRGPQRPGPGGAVSEPPPRAGLEPCALACNGSLAEAPPSGFIFP